MRSDWSFMFIPHTPVCICNQIDYSKWITSDFINKQWKQLWGGDTEKESVAKDAGESIEERSRKQWVVSSEWNRVQKEKRVRNKNCCLELEVPVPLAATVCKIGPIWDVKQRAAKYEL